ncbi:MAG: hypothetical protein ACRCZF_25085, partial [Gemmataceae bacterium]
GLFEDTPATVMKDIQEARAKGDKVKSDQIFQQARALASKPAATDAERMANLDSAMQMAYQAKNLHGPYSLWDLGDKPDSLIGEIEATKAQLRKKLPTVDTAAARSKMQQAQQATQTAANNVKSAVQGTMQQAASAVKSIEMPTLSKLPAPTLSSLPEPGQIASTVQQVASPVKAEVANLMTTARTALAKDDLVAAKAMAMKARGLCETAKLDASFLGENAPDAILKSCQEKGKMMVESLTRDAEKQIAAKKFVEADAALKYAGDLSNNLGLYAKSIESRRADVVAMMTPTKPMATTMEAPTVAVAPVAPPSTAITTPTLTVPTLAAPPANVVPVMPNVVATVTPPAPIATMPMPAPVQGFKLSSGEVLVPAGPAVPVTPVIPQMAPVPTPSNSSMLAQAENELRKGDLDMAKKLAIHAFNSDPAAKTDAQALLRTIDAEASALKRKETSLAFETACSHHASKKFESAMGIFKLLDTSYLTADQKAKHANMMADCMAQLTPASPATGVVTVAGTDTPGVAKVGGMPPVNGMADQQRAMADVAYQKLRTDGYEALNAANTAWGKGDTNAAMQSLEAFVAKVKGSSLSASQQAMLLRPIENRTESYRVLKHNADFLNNEAKDKADARRELLTANVAEAQMRDDLKKKFRMINDLTKAGKFKEAESAALQAKQLDPEDPTLTYLVEQTKFRRRSEEQKQLKNDQEKFNYTIFTDSEKTGPALTSDNPLMINPERSRIAAMRGDDAYLRTRTPQELVIDQKLDAPFSFKFENTSLKSVLGEIRQKTGLNIVTDDSAIEDEKVNLGEIMVTEEVKDIPLRDGLTILLSKARLNHVSENNVIKVTSEKRSKGRLKTKVFHVMDLVTPIPEFKAADHHRLDTAIAAGKGTNALAQMNGSNGNTFGGSTPFIPKSGLQGGEMVSGATPGLNNLFTGGTIDNRLQDTPVAMSPQRAAYSERLKKLITGMIRPYAWQGLGGPGAVEYFDIGGALVVNQTADVLKEVQDLLESLRRLQDLSVAVEVRVISLSETFFER